MAHEERVDLIVTGVLGWDDGRYSRGRVSVADGRIVAVEAADDAVPSAVAGAGAQQGGTARADHARDRTPSAGARHIDVGTALVLPGAVDAHVHSYSHAGEGLVASTSSAAAGGVTTIVEMPFDGPGPINTVDRLAAKTELVAQQAVIDVALLGTLEPHGGYRRAEELVAAGAVGFKVSLFDTDPRRFPRIDDADLVNVMAAIRGADTTVCVHAENNEIIKAALADPAHQDSTDPLTHCRTRPPVSETLGVLTAAEVAHSQGARLHLCHLSLGRSIQLSQWYRSDGADLTVETCPHYLTFTEDDMRHHGGRLKINPPLRPDADREAMWSALAAGVVDCVVSDHAPWPVEMKTHERILDNHSGVPGTQTLVALTLGAALRRYGLGPQFRRAVDALTIAPARRYGLAAHKGQLTVGADADLMVFTPSDDPISAADQRSNAGWSPYDGLAPGGAVTMTISRGRVVWDADQGLLGAPGEGRWVTRGGPS